MYMDKLRYAKFMNKVNLNLTYANWSKFGQDER